jgi:hypothetical protein
MLRSACARPISALSFSTASAVRFSIVLRAGNDVVRRSRKPASRALQLTQVEDQAAETVSCRGVGEGAVDRFGVLRHASFERRGGQIGTRREPSIHG